MEKHFRILMVDDDRDDQDLFGMAIRKIDKDIHCTYASNGVEALKALEHGHLPDVIFLDLNMPLMGGKQCLKKIRHTEQLKDIPVIIYTTDKHQSMVDEMLGLGANLVLTKRWEIQKQREEIAEILERFLIKVY